MKIWNRITLVCGCLLALYGVVWGIGYIVGRADGAPERRFLTETMPAADRDTLPAELLRDNVKYALRARAEFPWAAALPESIFLNEVLPYAVVDEPRENWRPKFYALFEPKVRGLQTIEEAIEAVNKDINKATGVEYDTRRARTNQSPSESMAQGMASYTGLSIILVDAFRSVGIPARFAGTAEWWDGRGNHSWVEVWVNGEWRFTEFYPDAAGLDNSWFVPDAGRSEVWATSWRETGGMAGAETGAGAEGAKVAAAGSAQKGGAFPMVWSPDAREVHGVDVSDRYRARWEAVRTAREASGEWVDVRIAAFGGAGAADSAFGESGGSDASADGSALARLAAARSRSDAPADGRVAVNVDVFSAAGAQLGGGRTSGPTDDAQRFLTVQVPKNSDVTLRWEGGERKIEVGEEPETIKLTVNR